MILNRSTNIYAARGAPERAWHCRLFAMAALAAVFSLSLAAPVTVDRDSGFLSVKVAEAGKGGNGGGGGGGGDRDRGDRGDRGNSDGGNRGGGDKGNNGNSAGSESDRGFPWLTFRNKPKITLAQFTTRIDKRYPADEIVIHGNPHQSVMFFTEFKAMAGHQVTHRWYHENKLAFETSFKIRADKWRAWSTQFLPSEKPGAWRVEVVDDDGKVLDTRSLTYLPGSKELATSTD